MENQDRYRAARDRLFRQAALLGPFQPRDLLFSVLKDDEVSDLRLQAELLSALRDASTVSAVPTEDTAETWLMRPIPRQKVLAQVAMAEIAPDTDIARALHGQGDFAPAALERFVAEPPDSTRLLRLVETLERAGPQAPGHRTCWR